MWPNPQFPADLVKFTENILNGKYCFLCSDVFRALSSIHDGALWQTWLMAFSCWLFSHKSFSIAVYEYSKYFSNYLPITSLVTFTA